MCLSKSCTKKSKSWDFVTVLPEDSVGFLTSNSWEICKVSLPLLVLSYSANRLLFLLNGAIYVWNQCCCWASLGIGVGGTAHPREGVALGVHTAVEPLSRRIKGSCFVSTTSRGGQEAKNTGFCSWGSRKGMDFSVVVLTFPILLGEVRLAVWRLAPDLSIHLGTWFCTSFACVELNKIFDSSSTKGEVQEGIL